MESLYWRNTQIQLMNWDYWLMELKRTIAFFQMQWGGGVINLSSSKWGSLKYWWGTFGSSWPPYSKENDGSLICWTTLPGWATFCKNEEKKSQKLVTDSLFPLKYNLCSFREPCLMLIILFRRQYWAVKKILYQMHNLTKSISLKIFLRDWDL